MGWHSGRGENRRPLGKKKRMVLHEPETVCVGGRVFPNLGGGNQKGEAFFSDGQKEKRLRGEDGPFWGGKGMGAEVREGIVKSVRTSKKNEAGSSSADRKSLGCDRPERRVTNASKN